MNKRSILSALIFAFIPLLYSHQAAAAVPPVDGRGLAAPTSCPTTLQVPSIRHFDKIVFFITGKLVAANPNDQPKLDALPHNTELDIKVQDFPNTVADLKGKVLTFLGALNNTDNRLLIRVGQVTYETAVCNPKGW